MGRPLLRRAFSLRTGLLAVLLAVVVLVTAKNFSDARVFQGYDAQLPVDARVIATEKRGGHSVEKLEITGLAGERIPLRMIRPAAEGRIPCVVFLYGIGQNARFFDKVASIFADSGMAMVMPEQFDCGERRRRKSGSIRRVLALRERSSRIVPETRRVVDFLQQHPHIDPERIFLLGASYGGITGCAVMANEPRLQKGVLVMAGGDLPRLLDFLARHRLPDSRVLVPAAAHLTAWFLKPFEPLDYVARIAPRPLLFLNVTSDELIAPASTRALFEKAKEPKQEIAYEGMHDEISEETVRRMLADAIQWMQGGGPY